MSTTQQEIGTVKWFNAQKGYGFIVTDSPTVSNGDEVFAHHSAIADQEGYKNLHEGERVRFHLVDRGKGPQAQNIHRLHAFATASDIYEGN